MSPVGEGVTTENVFVAQSSPWWSDSGEKLCLRPGIAILLLLKVKTSQISFYGLQEAVIDFMEVCVETWTPQLTSELRKESKIGQ